MSVGWGITVTLALLVLNAFFVGAEFALVAARRSAIEPAAEAGSRRAASTIRAMEQVSLMMAGAQLGITICSLALGAVSEPALAHLLEPIGSAAGLPDSGVHGVAFVIALALVTVLHVVLGEMVPKNITLAGPDRAALWLGPPLAALVRILKPVVWSLNAVANLVVRAVRVTPTEEMASTVTRDQLPGLVAESRREGLLDESEHERLTDAISFDAAEAATLGLGLDRIHSVAADASADDVERLAASTGVTRFPVRVDDELTGYVHLKDTLSVAGPDRDRPLPATVVRPLPAMAATTPLPEAVEIMRREGSPLAQLAGPDGRVVGILTLDDVLARLVGV